MRLTTLLLLFLIISCSKSSSDYQEKIIGDWKFEQKIFRLEYYNKYQIPTPPEIDALGYSFYNDGTYESKTRLYYVPPSKKENYGKWLYYPGKSNYIIDNDSLRLENPINKKWESYKLTSVSSDTLTLRFDDNLDKKFSRIKYSEHGKSEVDRIIISSSGCYGECPVESLSINSKGEVLFMGADYSVKKGFYSSYISSDKFRKILSDFERINFNDLDSGYYATHTDDETIDILFMRNDTIIKTIEDYGHEAPPEFIWAYLPLRHLSNELDFSNKTLQFKKFPIHNISFVEGNKAGMLTKSEMFLLFTEIQKAKTTDFSFKKKYTIKFLFNSDEKAIHTDGQHFSLPNHREITLDLGYNFFKRNNLSTRLEAIEE